MNVATPTKDCLELVNELLVPIIKARSDKSLIHIQLAWIAGSGNGELPVYFKVIVAKQMLLVMIYFLRKKLEVAMQ